MEALDMTYAGVMSEAAPHIKANLLQSLRNSSSLAAHTHTQIKVKIIKRFKFT